MLNDSAHFTGQISGFTGNTSISDVIDLKDINFAKAAETYTENSDGTGGTLTVSDGTDTAHINFSGGYVLGNFKFASDAQGGTLIMDPPVDDSPVSPPDINQMHTASSSENNGAYKVQGIDVPGIKNFVSQDGSLDHFDFGNDRSDVNSECDFFAARNSNRFEYSSWHDYRGIRQFRVSATFYRGRSCAPAQ